jgi:hypothetical protein
MAIPKFNAEASLLSPGRAHYLSLFVLGSRGSRLAPQARIGVRGSWPVSAGCVVQCIQHGGGSDAGGLIRACVLICSQFPGGIVF